MISGEATNEHFGRSERFKTVYVSGDLFPRRIRIRPRKWIVFMPRELAIRRRIKRKLKTVREREERAARRARWLANFKSVINPHLASHTIWWGKPLLQGVVSVERRFFHVHPFKSKGGIFCSICGRFENQHDPWLK